jgi:hypothetical protein
MDDLYIGLSKLSQNVELIRLESKIPILARTFSMTTGVRSDILPELINTNINFDTFTKIIYNDFKLLQRYAYIHKMIYKVNTDYVYDDLDNQDNVKNIQIHIYKSGTNSFNPIITDLGLKESIVVDYKLYNIPISEIKQYIDTFIEYNES